MRLQTPRFARFARLLVAAAVLATGLVGTTSMGTATAQATAVRIMPLGDSITLGGPGSGPTGGGYRFSLEDYLSSGGWNFDFVGTLQEGIAPLADRDHEGHSGFTIGQIDAGIAGWLSATSPDYVLLMAGTNDAAPTTIDGAAARLGALVDKINTLRPTARIIVAQIPPKDDFPAEATRFNTEMVPVINARIAAGKPVTLVNPGLTLSDLADPRHPNLVGYRKISRAYFDALRLLLPAPTLTGARQLSGILEVEGSTNGEGPIMRDRSHGNNTIVLNGTAFPQGLGTRGGANITYDLRNSRYATFSATVGIDDEVGAAGSSAFVVFVDEIQVFASGLMTGASASQSFTVPVAGASTLRIVQTDGSNGNTSDHGDWADAKLTLQPPGPLQSGGRFNAVAPKRLLDSRAGAPVGPRQTRNIAVLGQHGVPASGVQALALNVTVDRPTAPSFVSVFPRDDRISEPTTSNLNIVPGRATPALVIARPGINGQVSIYNSAGNVDVIVDVLGWFTATDAQAGARYHSEGPTRCFDTRSTINPPRPLNAGDAIAVSFTGLQSSAAAHRTAMMLNVTAANPTANGFLTVFPMDISRPATATLPDSSTVNFVANQGAVANATIAKVREADGYVGFYNSAGRTDVICDLFGYFDDGTEAAGPGQVLRTLDSPVRVMDSRSGLAPDGSLSTNRLTLTAGEARTIKIAGDSRSGVPATGISAVAVNVTAARTQGAGFISAFPATMPVATGQRTSILNFGPNQSVPNFSIVPLGNGQITLYNGSNAAADLIVDVFGYFVA